MAARDNPDMWLNQAGVYGPIASAHQFADEFARWLRLIWTHGTRAALSRYVGGAA
jgi:mannitol 2-dehydrogenase